MSRLNIFQWIPQWYPSKYVKVIKPKERPTGHCPFCTKKWHIGVKGGRRWLLSRGEYSQPGMLQDQTTDWPSCDFHSISSHKWKGQQGHIKHSCVTEGFLAHIQFYLWTITPWCSLEVARMSMSASPYLSDDAFGSFRGCRAWASAIDRTPAKLWLIRTQGYNEVRPRQKAAGAAPGPQRRTAALTCELMRSACPQAVGMLGGVFQVDCELWSIKSVWISAGQGKPLG